MCMGLAGIVLYSTTILLTIVRSPPDIWDACSLGLARVVCVCVCTLGCLSVEEHRVPCSSSPYLTPLSQGLSLKLELGWGLARASNPPASAPEH